MRQKTTSNPFNPCFLILLLLCMAVCGSSCTNDAEDLGDADYRPAAVHGTYLLTVMQTDNPSNFNKGSGTAVNLVEEMGCLQVRLQLFEDGTLESTYTDLQISEDPDTGEYRFACGKEKSSRGTYTVIGSVVKMDSATFTIYGDQLVDARKPDVELIDLVVFTKMP